MKDTRLSITKKRLDDILRAHGVTSASVFGSFARGDAGPESDLDLLVTYRAGTNLFDIIDLQNELERALGRKVDLVSEKYISTRLAKRIKDDVKPLSSIL
jgi:hypothetical protein